MSKKGKGGKSQSELASSFASQAKPAPASQKKPSSALQGKASSANTNTLAGILKASGAPKTTSSLFGTNKVTTPKPTVPKRTDASMRARGNEIRTENRARANAAAKRVPPGSNRSTAVVKPPKKTPKPPKETKVGSEPEQFFDSYDSSSEAPVAQTAIKTAPIDTVEFIDEALSAELLLDLLFEDVGGQELLTIARNDTVNGQAVAYQPFKNLGILQEIYNPANLLKLQETSDKLFSNFTINLRDKIPKIGNGLYGANYYLDLVAGDGIIEFVNLKSDEQVEIQIASAGIIEDVGI